MGKNNSRLGQIEHFIEEKYVLAASGGTDQALKAVTERRGHDNNLTQEEIVELEFAKGFIYLRYKNDLKKSEEIFNNIIKSSEKNNNVKGITNGLLGLGIVKTNKGEYLEAKKILETALTKQEKRADILVELANIYRFEGDYQQAEVYYRKASNIYKNQGDLKGILIPLYHLGYLLWRKGKPYKSLEVLQQAIIIAEEINVTKDDYIQALLRTSLVLADVNKTSEAEALLNKAINIITNKDMTFMEQSLHFFKGYLEESKLNFGQAIRFYKKIVDSNKVYNIQDVFNARLRIAGIYLLLYRGTTETSFLDKMETEIESVIKLAQKEQIFALEVELIILQVFAFIFDLKYEKALNLLEKAEKRAKKKQLNELVSRIVHEKGRVQALQNRLRKLPRNEEEELTEAQDYLKRCVAITREHFLKKSHLK